MRSAQEIQTRIDTILSIARVSVRGHKHRVQILNYLENIQFGVSVEPGETESTSGLWAFSNWNKITVYQPHTQELLTVSDLMVRVAYLLTQLGVATEWAESWVCCEECNGYFRSNPLIGGTVSAEGTTICKECLQVDVVEEQEIPNA